MEMPQNTPPAHKRASRMQALLALIIVAGAGALMTQAELLVRAAPSVAAVISATLVELTNADRTSQGLGTLTVSPILTQVAEAKADDMAEKGYFAHTSPEGLTPWHWFKEKGYAFTYAGENLAVDFSESSAVQRAWMNSPTHRANIVGTQFTEIGIAVRDGVYQGRPTTFVVQVFGTPARSLPTPQVGTTTKKAQEKPAPVVKDIQLPTQPTAPALATTMPTTTEQVGRAVLGESAGAYLARSSSVPFWFTILSFFK